MATAILERTLPYTEEESPERREARARAEEREAREFNGRISENYARIFGGEPYASEQPAAAPQAAAASAPVLEKAYAAPAADFDADMTARRISQYVPVRSIEKKGLFDGLSYKDGVLYDAAAVAAPVEIPVSAPAPMPAPAPAPMPAPAAAEEEDEDARPTSRTMETLRRREAVSAEPQSRQTFGAAYELTNKAKLLLAAIALVVVVALAIICVNTSVLSTLSTELGTLETAAETLRAQAMSIEQSIDAVQSFENVAEFAQQMGMILPA